jgi:hypothetical protein
MVVTKFRSAAALVLVALGIFAARASLLQPVNADEPAVKKAASDSKLNSLLRARLAVAQDDVALVTKAYQLGNEPFGEVLEAQNVVSDAQLELCETRAERVAVLERKLAQAQEYEKVVAARVEAAAASQRATFKAKLSRLEFEIALERE